jgi:hypothetical protein
MVASVLGPKVVSATTPTNGISMRLGDDARKCVVFFGRPQADRSISYAGTGFLAECKDESAHLAAASGAAPVN